MPSFEETIDLLKASVVKMLPHRGNGDPSAIWDEVLSVHRYLANLSPSDFRNIRWHTSFVTGEPTIGYWHRHPPIDAEQFAKDHGNEFFTNGMPEQLKLSEPPTPQLPYPLGVEHQGRIINHDTTRYQSCVTNLFLSNVLPQLISQPQRSLIVEIGGGYGGLANHLGRILRGKATYMVIDLPEMFLFSAAYVALHHPEARLYFYDASTFTPEFLSGGWREYDFVFVPNYALPMLQDYLSDMALMINMQSFQEMTREQIDGYASLGAAKLDGFLYSNNIDRHPVNTALAPHTVSERLAGQFAIYPPTTSYDGGINDPWLYRVYFGVSKIRPRPIPTGSMKYFYGSKGYEMQWPA